MRTTSRISDITNHLAIVALVTLAGIPAWSQTAGYGDSYSDGAYARIRYHDNGLTVRRTASSPDAGVGINSPLSPGDTVVTGTGQRGEIEIARGSVIRIDQSSEVTFLALPDPHVTFPDNTVLQLAGGGMRLTSILGDEEEFRIDTPGASIYLLGDGDFRVEVGSDGRTRVISRRGVAEVVGNGGSVLVRGGNRTEVYPDTLPARPEPFNTFASDSFDRWVERREAIYSADYHDDSQDSEAYDALPNEVQPYYRELSGSGDWRYTPEYGYVWAPYVEAGWRPYYNGRWSYRGGGYFWVSSEPWGWAPYHYGRWGFVAGSWCWIPGRVFAGAWVGWSWGSVYVGWAPLDYWNRPVYYGTVHYGYYDPYCWSFVRYEHFHHANYAAYAVTLPAVGNDIATSAVVTRPPSVGPHDLATSATARQEALVAVRSKNVESIQPVDTTRTPADNFTVREKAYVEAVRGRADGTEKDTRAQKSTEATSPQREGLPNGMDPLGPTGFGTSNAFPSYPRIITAPSSTAGTSGGVGGSNVSPTSVVPSSVTPRSVGPTVRGTTSDRSGDRRTMYQQLSTPRTTTTRDAATPSRTGSGSGSTTKAPPPSRGPKSAAPSRKPTSAPKKVSSARSSSGRSSGKSPSARPASSRSSGKSSSARPSSSRSSGNSSSSRGSSSRSSGSKGSRGGRGK